MTEENVYLGYLEYLELSGQYEEAKRILNKRLYRINKKIAERQKELDERRKERGSRSS